MRRRKNSVLSCPKVTMDLNRTNLVGTVSPLDTAVKQIKHKKQLKNGLKKQISLKTIYTAISCLKLLIVSLASCVFSLTSMPFVSISLRIGTKLDLSVSRSMASDLLVATGKLKYIELMY